MTEQDLRAIKDTRITAADTPISMNGATERLNARMIEWEEHPEHFDGVNPFSIAVFEVRQKTLKWEPQQRVMTLEEVKALPDKSDVWLEEFCSIVVAATVSHALQEIPESMRGPIPDTTSFYGIEHADYNNGEYENADYGKEWRCWTSRPSEEQMEATPWQPVRWNCPLWQEKQKDVAPKE